MGGLPIYFAPLQGYTEAPYRQAHAEVCGGIYRYCAPFARLEKGAIRTKELQDIITDKPLVIPQVIAKDSQEFSILCQKLADLGFTHIDLNMGCPFPKQTKAGRGAGLLPDKARVNEIFTAMDQLKQNKSLTFSVKMRLGQGNAKEGLHLIDLINNSALEYVVLHPRLGIQQYSGTVDLASARLFAENCQKPLIYNGDIRNLADIDEVRQNIPNIKGLMIGRGLLGRPTLAMEYQHGQELMVDDIKQAVLQLHKRVMAAYQRRLQGGDGQLLVKMVTFWDYLEPLFGHKFMKALQKARTLTEYQQLTN